MEYLESKEDYCTASPESVFGVDISSSCKLHDERYGSGVLSRKESDKELKFNIQYHFNFSWVGILVSWFYYIGVRLFGSGHYQPKKNSSVV